MESFAFIFSTLLGEFTKIQIVSMQNDVGQRLDGVSSRLHPGRLPGSDQAHQWRRLLGSPLVSQNDLGSGVKDMNLKRSLHNTAKMHLVQMPPCLPDHAVLFASHDFSKSSEGDSTTSSCHLHSYLWSQPKAYHDQPLTPEPAEHPRPAPLR